MISRLIENGAQVLSTGGGAFINEETRQSIHGTLLKRVVSKDVFALARKVLKYRPALLTASIRREFGIYDIGQPASSENTDGALSPSAEPQPE